MGFELPGFPPLPGGLKREIVETPLSSIRKEMAGERLSLNVEKMCEDPDFAAAFVGAVPEREEQKKYLLQSSVYELGNEVFDPHYVLFFRRTLPSSDPKHEERWTNEFNQVLNGLRREIPPGPHRLHSIILCDSLEHVQSNGRKEGQVDSFTDGEIVVNFPEYDHARCLFRFKPAREEKALEEYLRTEGATTAEEILREVRESKM